MWSESRENKTNHLVFSLTKDTGFYELLKIIFSGVKLAHAIEARLSKLCAPYGRKDGVWEKVEASGGINIISITYTELKNLCDNGQLVPGQSYRIIDYMCTTVTTNSRSANNQFDIIVTALEENTLSESASATFHVSDTYFPI